MHTELSAGGCGHLRYLFLGQSNHIEAMYLRAESYNDTASHVVRHAKKRINPLINIVRNDPPTEGIHPRATFSP